MPTLPKDNHREVVSSLKRKMNSEMSFFLLPNFSYLFRYQICLTATQSVEMNKTFIFSTFLLQCIVAASCCRPEKKKQRAQKKNSYPSVEDTLYLPFDTSRVWSLYIEVLQKLQTF
jgi:hypothetical protein